MRKAGEMALLPIRTPATHRRVGIGIISCVLGLTILTHLAFGFTWTNGSPRTPNTNDTNATLTPKETLPGGVFVFRFTTWLGPYVGQCITNSLGQPKPDGSGVLLLTQGVRRKEQFSGWWNMETPENGEYRFANGWKWYGDFSDVKAVGPLHAGKSWLTGLTFDDAERRAREVTPPQPPTTATTGIRYFIR